MKVINDGRSARSISYMWVRRSGEYYKDRPVVLYEYQKIRHHRYPVEYYRDFKGILITDGLTQYHLLTELPKLIDKDGNVIYAETLGSLLL